LQKGYNLDERDFFKNKFSRDEITSILKTNSPEEMFNFKSPAYKKLGLDKEKLSDEELIELMLKEPRLVRRPVVIINGNVHFGASASYLEKEAGV